jgi:hypothetical protein
MLTLGGSVVSSSLESSQGYRVLELHLVAGAAGVEWSLVGQQAEAARHVYVVTGNGTVDLSPARSLELVAGEVKTSVAQTQAAAALVTALTNVASGSIALVLGGLGGLGEVCSVEVEWIAAASQAKLAAKRSGPALVLEAGAAAGSAISFYKDAAVLVAKLPSSVVQPSASDAARVRVLIKL